MKTLNEKYRLKGDKSIWIAYILLLVVSLLSVFTSVGKSVNDNDGSIVRMFFKHFMILLIGFSACYVTHRINYVIYSRFSKILLGIATALLLLVLIYGYIGYGEGKAASRWIVLPFIGQFQPSEIAKYILILYTANTLALYREEIKTWQTFKRLVFPIAILCFLIFIENFSTAIILFAVCFALLFVGRVNLKYFFISILVVFLAVALLTAISSKFGVGRGSTSQNRIEQYFHNDPMEINQTNIAQMAIATGGLSGKFIGRTEEARFLSESHNDFIFAIILEEGGIVMCIFIIALYIWLLYRILLVARYAKGYYGKFTAIGIAVMFIMQAMVNMMVATNLLPVTGQTLPFISYGGTSLLFASIALGIVLNISKEENQQTRKQKLITSVDAEMEIEQDTVEETQENTSTETSSIRQKLEERIKEVNEDESNN